MDYELLKNRLGNGSPFLKERAAERISRLVNDLLITEAQAAELQALAEAKGLEVLPTDAMGRLQRLEETSLQQDEALMELAALVAGGV